MDVVRIILQGLLLLVFLASGLSKLTRVKAVVNNFVHLGVGLNMLPVLGSIEVIAALGLLIGFFVPVIAELTALGLIVFMIGAVSTHLALKDKLTGAVPAVVLGLIALTVSLLNISNLNSLFN